MSKKGNIYRKKANNTPLQTEETVLQTNSNSGRNESSNDDDEGVNGDTTGEVIPVGALLNSINLNVSYQQLAKETIISNLLSIGTNVSNSGPLDIADFQNVPITSVLGQYISRLPNISMGNQNEDRFDESEIILNRDCMEALKNRICKSTGRYGLNVYGPKGIGKSHALFVIANYFKRLFDIELSSWRVLYFQNWKKMTEGDVNRIFRQYVAQFGPPEMAESTSVANYIFYGHLKWLVIVDQLHDTRHDQVPAFNHSEFFPNIPNKCLVVTASSPHRNEAKLDGQIMSTYFFNETYIEAEVSEYLTSFNLVFNARDLKEIMRVTGGLPLWVRDFVAQLRHGGNLKDNLNRLESKIAHTVSEDICEFLMEETNETNFRRRLDLLSTDGVPTIMQYGPFFANLNLKYVKVEKDEYSVDLKFEVICQPVLLGISFGTVKTAYSASIDSYKSDMLLNAYNHFDGNQACQGYIVEELYFLHCQKNRSIFGGRPLDSMTGASFKPESRISWPDKPTLYKPTAFNYTHIDFFFCDGNDLYAIQVTKKTPIQHRGSLNFWKKNNPKYDGKSHVESLFGRNVLGKNMIMLWAIDSHGDTNTPPNPSVDDYDVGDNFRQIVAKITHHNNGISVNLLETVVESK